MIGPIGFYVHERVGPDDPRGADSASIVPLCAGVFQLGDGYDLPIGEL